MQSEQAKALHKLHQLVTNHLQENSAALVLRRAQVSPTQLAFLRKLGSLRDGMRMTEAARWFRFSTAAATGGADRLENLGLAERSHGVDDRRKVFLKITTDGLALISRYDEAAIKDLEELDLAGTNPMLERARLALAS